MRWQDSIWVVPPPQTQTVKKTTSRVVENIILRAYVAVSLMDRAKVIAPRSPAGHSTGNIISKQVCKFMCKTNQINSVYKPVLFENVPVHTHAAED